MIAVAGWVFGPAAASGQLFHQVNGLIGAAAGVQSIVENAHQSGGTRITALISFVLLVVGASGFRKAWSLKEVDLERYA